VTSAASALDRALLLLTPGTWGREKGLAVSSGDEWEVERIKLMRDTGRDELADHLRDDRIDFLIASDQDARAEVFRVL
jgi:hypothetical protein